MLRASDTVSGRMPHYIWQGALARFGTGQDKAGKNKGELEASRGEQRGEQKTKNLKRVNKGASKMLAKG